MINPKKNKKILIILLIVLNLSLFLFAFRVKIYLDGYPYYYWTHSFVFDRDVNLYNQYSLLPGSITRLSLTSNGMADNIFPVGIGLIYSPVLFLSSIANAIARICVPEPLTFGYEYFTEFSYLINTFFLTLIAQVLLFLLLIKYYSPTISLLSSLSFLFGTHMLGFSFFLPSFSHISSMFLCIVLLTIQNHEELTAKKRIMYFAIVSGLMVIDRYQNVFFLVIPLEEIIRKGHYKNYKLVGIFLFIFLVIISPQLVTTFLMYGDVNIFTQKSVIDFFYGFSWGGLLIFFHPQNGLFVLTPVILVGLIGLICQVRQNKESRIYLLIIVMTTLFIITRVDIFHADHYGMRRFITCLPLFILGLAYLLHRSHSKLPIYYSLIVIVTACSLIHVVKIINMDAGSMIFTGNLFRDLYVNTIMLPNMDGLHVIFTKSFFYFLIVKKNISVFLTLASIFMVLLIFAAQYTVRKLSWGIIIVSILGYTLLMNTLIITNYVRTEKYIGIHTSKQHATDKKKKKKKKEMKVYIPFEKEFLDKRKKLRKPIGKDRGENYFIRLKDPLEFPGDRFEYGCALTPENEFQVTLKEPIPIKRLVLVLSVISPKNQIKKTKNRFETEKMILRLDYGDIITNVNRKKIYMTPLNNNEEKVYIRLVIEYKFDVEKRIQNVWFKTATKCVLLGICIKDHMGSDQILMNASDDLHR